MTYSPTNNREIVAEGITLKDHPCWHCNNLRRPESDIWRCAAHKRDFKDPDQMKKMYYESCRGVSKS